jgi:hypothetical protein
MESDPESDESSLVAMGEGFRHSQQGHLNLTIGLTTTIKFH